MRTLTITRKKTFVGCLAKFKFYVEDANNPETTILNTPCRKLGAVKNGETQSFEIPEEAVRIFVIADKVSKGFCNEYYPIPAGTEDVALTGQCKFNPANGNAFRFDGVTDEAVLANRRKSSNKGLIVLVVAIVVGLVIGSTIGLASTLGSLFGSETFTGEGYSITLPRRFFEMDDDTFNAVYQSSSAVVMLYEETFTDYPTLQNTTPRYYARLMKDNVSYPSTDITETEDGLVYFDYTADVGNYDFTYRVFVFKGSESFWTVQISTPTKDMADMESKIMEWARSFELE